MTNGEQDKFCVGMDTLRSISVSDLVAKVDRSHLMEALNNMLSLAGTLIVKGVVVEDTEVNVEKNTDSQSIYISELVLKVASRSLYEPSEHEIDHGEMDEGFAGLGENLIVLGKAPIAIQPSESTFDNPTSRQKLESFDIIRAQHYIKNKMETKRNPIKQFPAIAAIDPDATDFFAGAR